MKVSIDLDADALRETLDKISTATTDMKPALQLAGIEALKFVARNFREEGRPKWSPLSPKTIERRRGKSGKILQDTGKLRNSIVNAAAGKAPGAVWQVSDKYLLAGTNLVYAATHQYGRDKIPARPYLPEPNDPELLAAIEKKLERYFADLVSRNV